MVNTDGGERRWQSDIRSFKGGIAYILKSMEFANVKLKVGRRVFKAHRILLAARSPQFAKMLMGEGNVPQLEYEINNVSEDAFEILINYIYTDSIGKLDDSQELVLDVYQAAIDYGQDGLKEACEKFIVEWDITCENVIAMLQMSDVQFVKDRCWEYLKTYARAVLKSKGILPAQSETLALIFERGYLNGIPVMELLKNVVLWAEKQYQKQADYKRVREHLLVPNGTKARSLMSWIGFEKLTATELGEVINFYPGLLTDTEIRMFLANAFLPEGKKSDMPVW